MVNLFAMEFLDFSSIMKSLLKDLPICRLKDLKTWRVYVNWICVTIYDRGKVWQKEPIKYLM